MGKGDTVETFMSSLIEMKLDQATKFAWQQHTHNQEEVPSIDKLLEFIDWRAQASELFVSRIAEWKYSTVEKKPKSWTSYQAHDK